MYDTDKYKNYMSMIPQSWLGKAKSLGWLNTGGGSAFGQLGNTDSRPTPDWLPKNFQSPNRKPIIENGGMADWFGSPISSRWRRRAEEDPEFENYGRDSETGEKYSYKDRPPLKFQSIGSDEKGNTKYEIRPYNDTTSFALNSLSSNSPDTSYTYQDILAQNPNQSLGLPGGVSWNYNPFQIYDRKTNRVDVQPWMEDRGQFAAHYGYANPVNDVGTAIGGESYTGEMTDELEQLWKKVAKGNYVKAASLYNKAGNDPWEAQWQNGATF